MEDGTVIGKISSALKGRVVRVFLDPDYEYPFIDNDEENDVFIDGEVSVLFSTDNSIATVFITDPGDGSFWVIPGNIVHSITSIPDDENERGFENDTESSSNYSGQFGSSKLGFVN